MTRSESFKRILGEDKKEVGSSDEGRDHNGGNEIIGKKDPNSINSNPI